MNEPRLPRKLSAILCADVVAYSRLASEDEEGTHRSLRQYLDLISNEIEQHKGKVVNFAGDAVLADFGTVIDALSCATSVQSKLAIENQDTPDERKFLFRIGINLGEVIIDRDDIYGDGVNVAARLESLSEPGGICISDAARSAVGSKLPLDYKFMGEQRVKNIKEPIRAYTVRLESDKPFEKITQELPQKPSIAVLPFNNMSGDPEQEYFADGVVEDIITDLSRFNDLLVIARNSSFSYKGKSIKIQELAGELGVRYVVEGSIRRAAERIRITAQLIDAVDESHVWGERYDRELRDIFDIQDEIVETIVRTVATRVERHGVESVTRKAPQDLIAYDYVLQARALICDSAENNRHCRELYKAALHIDPHSAEACEGISMTHSLDQNSGWGKSTDQSFEQALSYALKAVTLDDDSSQAHHRLGVTRLFNREYDLAEFHLDKALSLNPNNSDAWAYRGLYLIYTGQSEEALAALERATRRNPFHSTWYLWFVGLAYYCEKRYQDAIPSLRRSIEKNPGFIAPRRHLAACYAQLGLSDEAAEQVTKILELEPGFSIEGLSNTLSYRDPADLKHYLDGLRMAGLPD
jgi:adenylate cyclase